MNKLEDILKRVEDIPALPEAANRVLELMNDPQTHILKIAEAVQQDVALTTRVLKMANSAYYARERNIVTILEALVLLGLNTVKELVVAASTYKILNKKIAGYLLEKGDLWRHSLCSALVCERLAEKTHPPLKEKAYMAALLHDVGKIILAHDVADAFEQIIDKVENENMAFDDAEKQVLGFTHAELGARVLKKWNFPEELVDAIEHHHHPHDAGDAKLASLVHLADVASLMMGLGMGSDGLFYSLNDDAFAITGLSREDFEKVLSEAAENFARGNP